MNNKINDIEKRLWNAADQLRANSNLTAAEYSVPVLGLIFLRFADHKFTLAQKDIEKEKQESGSRIQTSKIDYQAKGVLFIPEKSKFSFLLNLPEGSNIGLAINEAMKAIEKENDNLKDVLPKDYLKLDNNALIALLKTFSKIPVDVEGDMFGRIYEYFLGKFAMAEGQRGGEFFTPTSLVKLIVEVIEPFKGRILDPASGSGGMFVQSAKFIKNHKKNPSTDLSIYGQEKTANFIRLCKMNLAINGLEGEVKQGNTYYEDMHNSLGKFDFLMANPPFNVNGIDKEKIKDDTRFKYGIPKANNANYLWIQIFLNALNQNGRCGFVMANSAADARQSELEIRKKIIEKHEVDVMISIGPNFFYTVTLPCTLWFFDRGKKNIDRKDKILFIDARNIFRQIDRAHRDFTSEQIEFIANIVRLYRGEEIELLHTETGMFEKHFPDSKYLDIPGLCNVATIEKVKEQGYSLNPGRYVGITVTEEDDYDFNEKLKTLKDELEKLNQDAHEREKKISENVTKLLSSNNE